MDLELLALGRARGRLVLLSPPVWEPGGSTYHNVRFSCVDDETVSGRLPTPMLSSLPPVNSACMLHVRPPATDLQLTRAHFGETTDSSRLSPVQFNPTPIAKVRCLKSHTPCGNKKSHLIWKISHDLCLDVVGVVTRGPCRKDFGNQDEKKFVIYISDQSSQFEVLKQFLLEISILINIF